jgi:hypothetical protein
VCVEEPGRTNAVFGGVNILMNLTEYERDSPNGNLCCAVVKRNMTFSCCEEPAVTTDRLCGLVVRVPGYRSRGPGFDSRRYVNF